jgi:hypothetical protein
LASGSKLNPTLVTSDNSAHWLWGGFHLFQQISTNVQPRIPLLLCEIPGHHLGTHFSHPQFFSLYQMNGFLVRVHFISNH